MSLNVRVLTLDNTGHGTQVVPPAFYAGASGGGVSNVTAADGGNLGTAFLARGSMLAVEGDVNVTGDANGVVSLFFDFD